MPADVVATMSALATAVDAIAGLRVFEYPPDAISPPAAVVAWPETVEYDVTAGRGSDRLAIPVQVMVGRVSDRASSAAVCAYLAGTGAASVKAAIESDVTLGAVVDTVRVQEAEVVVVTIGGTDYVAAIFTVEVIG